MAVFAKLFDTPGGQLLVRKAVAERYGGEEAPGIECVVYDGEVCFSMTAAFDTKANRDKAFDAVEKESFDGRPLFGFPVFFYENGLVREQVSFTTDPED